MVQRVSTVAFEGIEARAVDVQVQVAPGLPAFAIAGCECQMLLVASHGDCNETTDKTRPVCPA
jgi:magnesium chelatase family protein